jgi:hypothetical protein
MVEAARASPVLRAGWAAAGVSDIRVTIVLDALCANVLRIGANVVMQKGGSWRAGPGGRAVHAHAPARKRALASHARTHAVPRTTPQTGACHTPARRLPHQRGRHPPAVRAPPHQRGLTLHTLDIERAGKADGALTCCSVLVKLA